MQNILLGSCSRILKAKRDLRIQPNNFTDVETKAHRENITCPSSCHLPPQTPCQCSLNYRDLREVWRHWVMRTLAKSRAGGDSPCGIWQVEKVGWKDGSGRWCSISKGKRWSFLWAYESNLADISERSKKPHSKNGRGNWGLILEFPVSMI